MSPLPVATPRLELALWSREDAEHIRAGRRRSGWHPAFPRQDDRDAATLWVEGDPWGPRSIAHEGEVVGSLGFFGPPEPAADGVPEVEVGYGLVEDVRGRGLATEALTHLVALADAEGVRVRASVEPANTASLRVLAKGGFTEVRGTNEDGELVMVRPVRRVPGG